MSQEKSLAADGGDGQRVFFPLGMEEVLGSLCSTAERNVDVLGVVRSGIRSRSRGQGSEAVSPSAMQTLCDKREGGS